jgi:hypothetical protein
MNKGPLEIPELLSLILSFMPPQRQLVVRRVCKNWKRAVDERKKTGPWWDLYNSRDSIFAYKGLGKAAKLGCKSLVSLFISKGTSSQAHWELGLRKAARGGHKDLVEFFINKVTDDDWLSWTFYEAARGGHKEIVDFLISKDPPEMKGFGLDGAARGGHKELVDFFIGKGANAWNSAMWEAARGGHMNLVIFFIQKGANDLEWGLEGASLKGDMDLVNFFIQKGENDWDNGLSKAAIRGRKELIDFYIEKGANLYRNCSFKCKEVEEYVKRKIDKREKRNIENIKFLFGNKKIQGVVI